MERFYLSKYIEDRELVNDCSEGMPFEEVCSLIRREFSEEWEKEKSRSELVNLQKKAIIGHPKEKEYFQRKIRSILREKKLLGAAYPKWYQSQEEAIYHELWGLSGIAEWFYEEHRNSSSAKVIGDRIYFMEKGSMVMKPQKIPSWRREQLIRAFLLVNPQEKSNKDFHELYLLDGTRVTIFRNGLTKAGEETIIFRRYIMPTYTFEEQAEHGTIPGQAVELFKSMVALGFNCAFVGEIRSAKTTFLTTWQNYEDRSLEGVLVETDPEIPLHHIMPEAPIVQVIADGDKLNSIVKNLMRSDADYFIIGEARDGIALSTAVRIADRGGRRLKMTFHLKNPLDFPYNVAEEIVNALGGDVDNYAVRTASAFDYLFHLGSLQDKSKKRLLGIYEISGDKKTKSINIERICEYSAEKDSWRWKNRISADKKQKGEAVNPAALEVFKEQLEILARSGRNEE